jgi:glycosyltransferase involved in cell wall biosynthesis
LRAFHNVYNPTLAVRVVSLLARRFPDVQLTMVGADKGDGALQAAEALADTLGVRDRIRFGGPVSKREVPQVLSAGDIFLNTTNTDNAPVSVLEAMACGLCVVSTNVGGVPYLVEDERTALLVPPDNADAMAGAVLRILENPELADRLSRNGREKAECCDWTPIIGQWRSLLAATAARSRPASAA